MGRWMDWTEWMNGCCVAYGEVMILAHATSQRVNALFLSHYYNKNISDNTFQTLFWAQKGAGQCFEVRRFTLLDGGKSSFRVNGKVRVMWRRCRGAVSVDSDGAAGRSPSSASMGTDQYMDTSGFLFIFLNQLCGKRPKSDKELHKYSESTAKESRCKTDPPAVCLIVR